jgi:DNA-binding NarL/FixJ family response regulator
MTSRKLPPVPEPASINVLIIEDHSMVGAALAGALEAEDGITVIDVVTHPSGVREAMSVDGVRVDVILLDLRLGEGADALSLIPQIRQIAPRAKIVVLSAWSDDRSIARAIEAGCDGYLLKEQHVDELIAGIRTVVANEAVFAPSIMKRVFGLLQPSKTATPTLSTRELEVLQRLGDGMSTVDIAASLFLSSNTVRNHIQSIMQKLGVHSRLEAVAHGVRAGLITVT